MFDETLLVRLARTLGDLTQIGGQEERSRAYLGAAVTANSGSATPPPAGFVQSLVDGVGMLCRYFGAEPAVGDNVALLMVENSNPLVIFNQSTGLLTGWPFDAIITVSSTNPAADYATIAAAIAAPPAVDDTILVSPEQFVCDNQTLPANVNMLGWDWENCQLITTAQVIALTLGTNCDLGRLYIENNQTNAAAIAGLYVNGSSCELWEIYGFADNGGAGDGYGIQVENTRTVELIQCRAEGYSSGGNGYAVYVADGGSATIHIRDGWFEGGTADIFIGSGSTLYLYGPRLETGVIAGTGTVEGWWYNVNGVLMVIDSELGLGTSTVPHGGIGRAMLAIDGPQNSAAGPHIQITTDEDDYPVFQMYVVQHDSFWWAWDCYYDGAHRSSDAGTNYRLVKDSDELTFEYDSGIAQGAVITWNVGLTLRATGRVGVLTNAPNYALDVEGNIGLRGGAANQDRYIYFASDAYIFWDESEDAFSFPKDVGIGTNTPSQILHVYKASGATNLLVESDDDRARLILDAGATSYGEVYFYEGGGLNFAISDWAGAYLGIWDASTPNWHTVFEAGGNVGIGIGLTNPTARLHVVQVDGGAEPALLLNQADLSEEMIEYVSTIGVGNPIEAVGAKSLTVTHFIKVTLPGGLTRYQEVGTIA